MHPIDELINRNFPDMEKHPYMKMFVEILTVSLSWVILCKVGYVIGQVLYYTTH